MQEGRLNHGDTGNTGRNGIGRIGRIGRGGELTTDYTDCADGDGNGKRDGNGGGWTRGAPRFAAGRRKGEAECTIAGTLFP